MRCFFPLDIAIEWGYLLVSDFYEYCMAIEHLRSHVQQFYSPTDACNFTTLDEFSSNYHVCAMEYPCYVLQSL